MKADKWVSALWAALIAFLAALGGVGCMVTGFKIEGISLVWVIVSCALGAAVFSLCFSRRVAWFPMGGMALLGGYLWRKGLLSESVEGLVFHISSLYDSGYGWGILQWTDMDPTQADMTLSLCVVGLIVAVAVTWTVVCRRSGWLAVTVSILPLASCMVLTDAVPRELWLYLLLFSLVMLLLTQNLRRRDVRKGNVHTAMVAVPVALALALLFLMVPREGYNGQAGAQRIEDFVVELLGLEEETKPTAVGAVGDMAAEQVDLTLLGPKSNQASKVMEITSQKPGQYYLRGCAYDIYDGLTWSASDGQWALEADYTVSGQAWEITLTTMRAHDVLYMPGVSPELLRTMEGGRVENTKQRTRYTMLCTAAAVYDSAWDTIGGSVSIQTASQYLQLPQETAVAARNIVVDALGAPPENSSAGTIWKYAQNVADLVKDSADYDLRPRPMPEAETDFALWFLNSSDTGYCVHFATTTTVLLRSVGIPARYVTGYLADAKANVGTMVRLRDAHAWVEVYLSGVGWVVLEATPSGYGSPVPPSTGNEPVPRPTPAVTAPQETTEETTQATTQSTEPQTTQPGNIGGVTGPDKVQKQGTERLWLLLCLAAVLALIGQWRLRLWLRYRKQHTGKPNTQALARWREVTLHARLLGQTPDASLHILAQKARFSQHTLTHQELKQFDAYLARSRKALRSRPVWHRLLHTVILALY